MSFQFTPNAWKIAQRAIYDMLHAPITVDVGTGVLSNGVTINSGFPIETHSNYAALISAYTHADAGFRAPYLNLYKSRGTQASPAAVTLTGYEMDSIGGINFGGHDGTDYVVAAGIYSQVSQNWSSEFHGAFLSVYYTSNLSGRIPRQIIQFGGIDAVDQAAGGGTIDYNIVAYAPLAFGGNKSANPCIQYVNANAVGVQPRIKLRSSDDSIDATLECGQIFWKPGASATPILDGQVALEVVSDTQIRFRLRGSDGTVRSSAPITLS